MAVPRFAGVPNLGKPLYIEKTLYIKTHKTAINRSKGEFGKKPRVGEIGILLKDFFGFFLIVK